MLFFLCIFSIVPISEEERLFNICNRFNITNKKAIYRLYMLLHNPDFHESNITDGEFLVKYLIENFPVENTENFFYNITSVRPFRQINIICAPFLIPYVIYITDNNFIIDMGQYMYTYVPNMFSVFINRFIKLEEFSKLTILDEKNNCYDVIMYFIEVYSKDGIKFVFYKNSKFYSIMKNDEIFLTYYDETFFNMNVRVILVKLR